MSDRVGDLGSGTAVGGSTWTIQCKVDAPVPEVAVTKTS